MRLDDKDYEELLSLYSPQDIPEDQVKARQSIENFLDLIELFARSRPQASGTESSLTQPFSIYPKPAPPVSSPPQSN